MHEYDFDSYKSVLKKVFIEFLYAQIWSCVFSSAFTLKFDLLLHPNSGKDQTWISWSFWEQGACSPHKLTVFFLMLFVSSCLELLSGSTISILGFSKSKCKLRGVKQNQTGIQRKVQNWSVRVGENFPQSTEICQFNFCCFNKKASKRWLLSGPNHILLLHTEILSFSHPLLRTVFTLSVPFLSHRPFYLFVDTPMCFCLLHLYYPFRIHRLFLYSCLWTQQGPTCAC